MQLGDMIEETLGSPLDRPAILNMLTSLCLYVFSCHRVFAQVANRKFSSLSLPRRFPLRLTLSTLLQLDARMVLRFFLSSATSGRFSIKFTMLFNAFSNISSTSLQLPLVTPTILKLSTTPFSSLFELTTVSSTSSCSFMST